MKKLRLRNLFFTVLTIILLFTGTTQTVFAQNITDDIDISGTILSIDETEGSFLVETETGNQYVVYPGSDFDMTSIVIGDQIEVEGTLNGDGSISAYKSEVEIPEADEQESDESTDGVNTGYYCSQSDDQHPFGAKLSEEYEMDYGTIQTWFCEGSGWGEIMLAARSSKITGGDPAEMIAARKDGSGWGEIWQEAELIGKPDKEKTVTSQEDKEKPNADKTPGPPDEKEKKPKKVK